MQNSSTDELPIIDPDVIGPEDFRNPFVDDAAFGLWKTRREWVDQQLIDLRKKYETEGLEGQNGLIFKVFGEEPAALADSAARSHGEHHSGDAKKAKVKITKEFGLTVEAFTKLMAIVSKLKQEAKDIWAEKVTRSEWQEFLSILVQTLKAKHSKDWIKEESNLVFGLENFCVSPNDPVKGDWPPNPVVDHAIGCPAVDPELVRLEDLSPPLAGRTVRALWQNRRAWLDKAYKDLKRSHDDQAAPGSFAAKVSETLHLSVKNLKDLETRLKSADKSVSDAAAREITKLGLTPLEFTFVMELGARENDPTHQPTAEEYQKADEILVGVLKKRDFYPGWIEKERQIPLIDPEVVDITDIGSSLASRRARAMWRDRRAKLQEFLDDLQRNHAGSSKPLLSALEKLCVTLAGSSDVKVTVAQLDALYDQLIRQTDPEGSVQAITSVLRLPVEDFKRLMMIKAKEADPRPGAPKPSATETADFYAILVSARKPAQFPVWNGEERPDKPDGLAVFYWQAVRARLPEWRATAEGRQGWQRALRTRTSTPLIEPDLIDRTNLEHKSAFRWDERKFYLNDYMANIRFQKPSTDLFMYAVDYCIFEAIAENTFKGEIRRDRERYSLDYVLIQVFGDFAKNLGALYRDLGNADTRRTIAFRLCLTANSLGSLVALIDKDHANPASISNPEWEIFYGTLAQPAVRASFFSLLQEKAAGHQISRGLQQLGLEEPAFTFLVQVCDELATGDPVLDSEWQEVCDILTQVMKRRLFARWREEEKRSHLILSPDFFKLASAGESPAGNMASWQPRKWRSTWADRRAWEDTLQSRIDQVATVNAALTDAIAAVEEATLPALRDALILASDAPGTDLATKADAITDRLLIDARAGAGQKTTRLAQPIETLQALLWSVRSYPGERRQTHPTLEGAEFVLDAESFDEEWKWLGSYDAWRSAMAVFLFPENLLFPSLRRTPTPAFKQLVDDLQSASRLSPDQVREKVHGYSDYLKDISTLCIVDACYGPIPADNGRRQVLNLFARTQSAGKERLYWSVDDERAWAKIPNIDGMQFIRAVTFGTDARDQIDYIQYLYIFLRNGTKCYYIRQNVKSNDTENGGWDSAATDIALPAGADGNTFGVQRNCARTYPPRLLVQVDPSDIYIFDFDIDGSPGPWVHAYHADVRGGIKQIFSAQLAENSYCIFINCVMMTDYLVSSWYCRYCDTFSGGSWQELDSAGSRTLDAGSGETWQAYVFEWYRSGDVYIILDSTLSNNKYACVLISRYSLSGPLIISADLGWPNDLPAEASFPFLICPSQQSPEDFGLQPIPFFTQLRSGPHRCNVRREADNHLRAENLRRVTPALFSGFDLAYLLLNTPSDQRNSTITSILAANANNDRLTNVYLEEAFYFLPVQMALELQRSRN